MDIKVSNNKRYEKYNISEDISIFDGTLKYMIDISLVERLAKDLGFSYSLYSTLVDINKESAKAMIRHMSLQSKHTEIHLLVDEESNAVVDYSLDSDRTPLLNSDFINRVQSLVATSDAIRLSEVYYSKEDKVASVIIRKVSPILIEEKYEGKESNFIDYDIGVLLVNDESNTTYSRLVLYVDGRHPIYLPASYYNSTASRYRRSTNNSAEALEVLVLKIIEDLREDELKNKIYELHYQYRTNKSILASYEEYNTLLRTMRKIPAIIDDNSFLDTLTEKYENFEKKYTHVDSQKSSYIWRCTALGDTTIGNLVSITSQILSDLYAPPVECFTIRELLGSYISTNRIAEEIAKEDNL